MGLDEVWLRVPKAHDYHRLCVSYRRACFPPTPCPSFRVVRDLLTPYHTFFRVGSVPAYSGPAFPTGLDRLITPRIVVIEAIVDQSYRLGSISQVQPQRAMSSCMLSVAFGGIWAYTTCMHAVSSFSDSLGLHEPTCTAPDL